MALTNPSLEELALKRVADNIKVLAKAEYSIEKELHVRLNLNKLIQEIALNKKYIASYYKEYTGSALPCESGLEDVPIYIHIGNTTFVAEKQTEVRQQVVDLGYRLKET